MGGSSTIFTATLQIIHSRNYGLPCILSQNRIFFYKLGVVQRGAIRLALGLRNSTPNRVVYAEAYEHPLHIHQSKLADTYSKPFL